MEIAMSNKWKYSKTDNTVIVTKPLTGAEYSFQLDEVESDYTICQKIKNFPVKVQSLIKSRLKVK